MKTLFVASIMIFMLVFVAGCTQEPLDSYTRFGLSFDYRADMEVKESGILNRVATEEEGEISLQSQGEPVRNIVIRWVSPPKKPDVTALRELQDDLLAIRDVLAKAEQRETVHADHTVVEQRYIIVASSRDLSLAFIRTTGIWVCDIRKLVYIVTVTAPTSEIDTKIIYDGNEVRMPPPNKDPSYHDYTAFLASFRGH